MRQPQAQLADRYPLRAHRLGNFDRLLGVSESASHEEVLVSFGEVGFAHNNDDILKKELQINPS
jgi:hypothetical protein